MNKTLVLLLVTSIISLLSSSSVWSGFKSIRDLRIDCEKDRPICKSYIEQTIKGLATGRSWTEYKDLQNNNRWCLPSALILEDYKNVLFKWLNSNPKIDRDQSSKQLLGNILNTAFPCPDTKIVPNYKIKNNIERSQQYECPKNWSCKQ